MIHGPDAEERGQPADPDVQAQDSKNDLGLYGIFYEDGYDYLQHLKDVSELQMSKMEKVAVTFREDAAEEEFEDVYKLSQAAQIDFSKADDPDWDPEIKAILEEETYGDDEDLEDNFFELADPFHEGPKDTDHLSHHLKEVVHISPESNNVADVQLDSDQAEFDDDDDDEWEDEDSDAAEKDSEENVITRNNLLTQLDEQTRELLRREFGEDQIGALELEEPRGRCGADSALMKQVFNDKDANKIFTLEDLCQDKIRPNVPESWKFVEEVGEEELKERDDKIHRRAWSPKRPQWDCETILSTLSTTKNHPKTLTWPSSGEKKQKLQKEPECKGLSLKEIEEMRRAERTADAPPTFRPSGETPEERKDRKKAVKLHRKERREEKKANKMAFRAELLASS